MSVAPMPLPNAPTAPYAVECEVRADDQHARPRQALFDQHLMRDTATGVEAMADALLASPDAQLALCLRRGDRRRRRDVVYYHGDAIGVPYALGSELLVQHPHHARRDAVVDHREVDADRYHIAGVYLMTGGVAQYLFA